MDTRNVSHTNVLKVAAELFRALGSAGARRAVTISLEEAEQLDDDAFRARVELLAAVCDMCALGDRAVQTQARFDYPAQSSD